MADIMKAYELWLEKATEDSDLIAELRGVEGKTDEINDRFYRELEFGTAGLRGVIGAGTNRMNVYTVNQATQGLASYLLSEYESPAVAIAYDSRIKSTDFSKSAAGVLAANGVKVYIYPELVPTPMLSFVDQMTDEAAAKTYEFIQKTDMFSGVKTMDFDEAVEKGLVEYIGDDIVQKFYDCVEKCCLSKDITAKTDLKVIYTPLNGTGNKHVRAMLKRIGIKDVSVVKEQELPDGNFPTCPYPNPEIKQVFECAIKMTEHEKADLLLATDPDCDRVGIAVLDNGEYKLMSGNEVGVLLAEYLLSRRKELGILPENAVVVKSFVTTDLVDVVCKKYGASVKKLLTGFKYIGEYITELEAKGEANRFVVGMEESYGYLSGIHARDKDAVVASTLICEMAAYYKEKGISLYEKMQEIYAEHGYYLNRVESFEFKGETGMEKMASIMETLRNDSLSSIAGYKVLCASDYKKSETVCLESGKTEKIELPKSNVLAYALEGANGVIIRPSGTEPKIKVYFTARGKTKDDAEKIFAALSDDMKQYLK